MDDVWFVTHGSERATGSVALNLWFGNDGDMVRKLKRPLKLWGVVLFTQNRMLKRPSEFLMLLVNLWHHK